MASVRDTLINAKRLTHNFFVREVLESNLPTGCRSCVGKPELTLKLALDEGYA